MNQPIISLNSYRDPIPFDFGAYNRRAAARFRLAKIRWWVNLVVDVVATLAITGCTIFCCWIALTML